MPRIPIGRLITAKHQKVLRLRTQASASVRLGVTKKKAEAGPSISAEPYVHSGC